MAVEAPDPVGSTAGHLLRDLKWSILASLAGLEAFNIIDTFNRTGTLDLDPIPEGLAALISQPIGEAERLMGQPLFELLVEAPTGVAFSRDGNSQESQAVSMVERLLGFAVALPYGVSKMKALLEGVMGENASKALVEALEKIPEDIGINWAIGMMLESILEVAAKQPIEEKIAEQTRPSRLEWPQLRALARQRAITDDQLKERLAKAGFRDEDIDLIHQIDQQLLSVSDLQAAYAYGIMDEPEVRAYFSKLGIEGRDQDIVTQVYLKKTETTGGDQLRAVAQKEYLDGHITEGQYRALLDEANVPEQSIDLEVRAASLAKQYGRTSLGVADIKRLRQDGVLDDRQATARLVGLGYVEDDALSLVKEWSLETKAAKPGLTESRVLMYLKGGLLTEQEAYDRLVGLGIKSDDAHFLVQHPDVIKGAKSKGSTEADIIDAYKDGIINQDEASQRLQQIGIDTDAAALKLRIANFTLNRAPKKRAVVRHLTDANVLDAFKQGLATAGWAERELATLGYSTDDAHLIVAVEETKLSGAPPDGWVQLT